MILHVDVVNKIATFQKRDGSIVCGNNDYKIKFTFDSEWSGYTTKTARFISKGRYTDVDFTGEFCDVPILYDTTEVEVGVYAGELITTTRAIIGCQRSILCELVKPSEENDRTHANAAKEAADRAEAAAEEATEKVEEAVQFATEKVETATNDAADRAEAAAVKAEEAADRAELEGGGISTEVDNRLKALEAWMADENYVSMTASLQFYDNGSNTKSVEYADKVKDVNLQWSTSKKVSSLLLTLPSGDEVDVSEAELPYEDGNEYTVTSQKTWTLTATRKDGKKETKSASAYVSVYYRVYYGLGTQAEGFDATFMTSLSNGTATSKNRTLSFDSADNQYVYYAFPEDLKNADPKFDINGDGFIDNFEDAVLIPIVKNGVTINYYLYRSTNLLKSDEPFTVVVS